MSKPNVATRNAAMQKVYDKARKVRDLMGGTDRMRAMAETYLHKKEAESQKAYEARLKQTVLYGKLADVIDTTATKLLAKPIKSDNDGLESVDSEGRDLTRFAMEWLLDALQGGVSYCLTDYPTTNGALSVEQEAAAGLRPYASIIKHENLLSFDYEMRGANIMLTRVNIMESVSVDSENEFEEEYEDQVRVLRLRDGVMTVELWRQQDGKDWAVYEEETATTQDHIPLTVLYTKRTGFMTGECPFLDIADLNITHWQSSSSQRHILDFVRFPILFGKGILNDGGQVELGPNRLIMGDSSENSDLKHVEHSGAGIDAGVVDLTNLETQMDDLSKQTMTRRTGNITATARAIDESSSTTDIQALANIVQDTINKMLEDLGSWTNTEYEDVSLSVDFSLGEATAEDVKALQFAVTSGSMSKEEYMRELVRRGIKKEYDIEVDMTEIETVAE